MLETYSFIRNKSIKVSIDGHGSDESIYWLWAYKEVNNKLKNIFRI